MLNFDCSSNLEEKLNKLKMEYLNVSNNIKVISIEDNLKLDLLIKYYLNYFSLKKGVLEMNLPSGTILIEPMLNQLESDILISFKSDYENFDLDVLSLRSFSFLFLNNLYDYSNIDDFSNYIYDKSFREILLLESFKDYVNHNSDLCNFMIDYIYDDKYNEDIYLLFKYLSKNDILNNLGLLNNVYFKNSVLENANNESICNNVINYLLSENDFCRALLCNKKLINQYNNIDFVDFIDFYESFNNGTDLSRLVKGISSMLNSSSNHIYILNLDLLKNSNIEFNYLNILKNLPDDCLNRFKKLLIKYIDINSSN